MHPFALRPMTLLDGPHDQQRKLLAAAVKEIHEAPVLSEGVCVPSLGSGAWCCSCGDIVAELGCQH